MDFKKIDANMILLIVLLYVVYVKVLKPVLDAAGNLAQGAGLSDTPEVEKEKKQLAENTNRFESMPPTENAFSPKYWQLAKGIADKNNGKAMKVVQKVELITVGSAENLCRTIKDAMSLKMMNVTYPEKIEGVFKQLKYKSQVSFLCEQFYRLYKYDLFGWLQQNLNATDILFSSDRKAQALSRILKHVDSLTTGIIAVK